MRKSKSWVQGLPLREWVLLVGHLTTAGGLSRVTEVARTVRSAQHEHSLGGEISGSQWKGHLTAPNLSSVGGD